ncbi:MAG TPA: menaquinone biosynthesis protein [Ktedonobacterales bacterium]
MSTPSQVTLGVIEYLNAAPVWGPLSHMSLPGIALRWGVPAAINAALSTGAVDIANVSSLTFGQHAREWLLAPDLAVGAGSAVESVVLFSWHSDWRALDGRTIAVTTDSATSVALLRLLCEERYGIHATFAPMPSDLDAMLATHDAALIIGDRALIEMTTRRAVAGRGVPHAFDMAAEWHHWQGLPFVFAVWAIRADRAAAVRASGLLERLAKAKASGLGSLPTLAADAARRLGLPEATCLRYLRLLHYDLTSGHMAGLRAFLEGAIPGFRWADVRTLTAAEYA